MHSASTMMQFRIHGVRFDSQKRQSGEAPGYPTTHGTCTGRGLLDYRKRLPVLLGAEIVTRRGFRFVPVEHDPLHDTDVVEVVARLYEIPAAADIGCAVGIRGRRGQKHVRY